jgi:hypothetical protein
VIAKFDDLAREWVDLARGTLDRIEGRLIKSTWYDKRKKA